MLIKLIIDGTDIDVKCLQGLWRLDVTDII